MPITIGANIGALRAQRQLDRTADRVATHFERLSTGMRINSASDDAAGLAIASSLNADKRVYTQAIRNVNDSISALAIAEGALAQLSNIVIRQKELAEQAANGIYTYKQRQALDNEAQALKDEFRRIIDGTEFNGRRLFGAETVGLRVQAGYGTDESINGQLNQELGAQNAAATGTISSDTDFGSASFTAVFSRDINGDGNIDLLGVAATAGQIRVMLGNGDGTFQAQVNYQVTDGQTNGNATEFADLNGDGIFDFVAKDNSNAGYVGVMLGNSDGTFDAYAMIDTGYANLRDLALVDTNNDNILDVVGIDTLGTAFIMAGAGNGTFGAPGSTFAITLNAENIVTADPNADGITDIVVTAGGAGGSATVMLGNGANTFTTSATLMQPSSEPGSYVFGDFNGDGHEDLFLRIPAQGKLYFGDGTGAYSGPQNVALSMRGNIEGYDVNEDGILDLVGTLSSADGFYIALGNGNGTFQSETNYTLAGMQSEGLSINDFNNDGAVDFVVADNGNNVLTVLISEATASAYEPDFSLATQSDARDAMSILDGVLQRVGRERNNIGSFESRLLTASAYLRAKTETTATAESRILDADIAEESSGLIRSQINQQVAAAILAQANQQPTLALSLLNVNSTRRN